MENEKLVLEVIDYRKYPKGGYAAIRLREPPTGDGKRGKTKWVPVDDVIDKIQKGLIEIKGVGITPTGRLHIDSKLLKTPSYEILEKKIEGISKKMENEKDSKKKSELYDKRKKLIEKLNNIKPD